MSSVNLGPTTHQAQLIELYSDNPPRKILDKCVDECVKTVPFKMKLNVYFISGVRIVGGAIAGGTAGYIAGTSIGACYPIVGSKIGGIAGATVGGLAGGAIGNALARRKITVDIEQTTNFIEWKKNALRDNLYPLFERILHDNIFLGLVCPISHELPIVPVRTPCGHIYEMSDITHWLSRKKPDGLCCVLGCAAVFTANDLAYSQEHIRKIMEAAKLQINFLKAQGDASSKELENGMNSYGRDVHNVSNTVLKAINRDESKLSFDMGMSRSDFLRSAEISFDMMQAGQLD